MDVDQSEGRSLAGIAGLNGDDVLVILGSGLAGAAALIGSSGPSLPLATLPFFPRYTATGHHAEAWAVPMGDKMVLVFGCRAHMPSSSSCSKSSLPRFSAWLALMP